MACRFLELLTRDDGDTTTSMLLASDPLRLLHQEGTHSLLLSIIDQPKKDETHLMLELFGVSGMHWCGRTVDVQLPDQAATARHAQQLFPIRPVL